MTKRLQFQVVDERGNAVEIGLSDEDRKRLVEIAGNVAEIKQLVGKNGTPSVTVFLKATRKSKVLTLILPVEQPEGEKLQIVSDVLNLLAALGQPDVNRQHVSYHEVSLTRDGNDPMPLRLGLCAYDEAETMPVRPGDVLHVTFLDRRTGW